MKTYNEIIKQKPVFLHHWGSKVSLLSDFEDIGYCHDQYEKELKTKIILNRYKDVNILFASYSTDNYSGDAWVLFQQDGILYEINGGHCSCYGLEGQWNPEQVTLDELKHRLLKGTFGVDDWTGNTFKNELCEFLGVDKS